MKLFLVIAFLLFNKFSFSQEISGTWVGNYGKGLFMFNPQKLVVELFLYKDSLLTGTTHLYYKNNKYEHYTVQGKYNKKDSTVFFVEDSTIALKLGFMSSNCLGKYQTKLIMNDTIMKMQGKWKDKSSSILFRCPSTSVILSKKINLNKKDIKPDKEKANERATDIQSLIEIDKKYSDSIKVEIYDNGEIDNDTISLYQNNYLMIDHKMISAKPLTFYINLTADNPITLLKLIAENIGTIPPCTALMIVTTKNKRYEVNLKSDFYKNGVVELFLKE